MVDPALTWADYDLSPTGLQSVEQIGSSFASYRSVANGVVGAGFAPTQYHTVVSEGTFNLSGVPVPIGGITLTGSMSNLRTLGTNVAYAPAYYALLSVSVTAMSGPIPGDLPSLFAMASQGLAAGAFRVDDGVATSSISFPAGGTFSIDLNANVVALAEASRLSGALFNLGFSGSGTAAIGDNSVEGDLSFAIVVHPVPEPAAVGLLAVGLAGLLASGRLTRRLRPTCDTD